IPPRTTMYFPVERGGAIRCSSLEILFLVICIVVALVLNSLTLGKGWLSPTVTTCSPTPHPRDVRPPSSGGVHGYSLPFSGSHKHSTVSIGGSSSLVS